MGEGCAARTGSRPDGGTDLTTLFKHDKLLEKKRHERCLRHAVGSGNRVVLVARAAISSWAGGVAALSEMRGRGRGHASLVPKATQAKHNLDCFWLRGVVHKAWELATIWIWRVDRSQFVQGPTSEARGVGSSYYLGHDKLS